MQPASRAMKILHLNDNDFTLFSHSQTGRLHGDNNDEARKLHYVKHVVKYLSAYVFWDAINKSAPALPAFGIISVITHFVILLVVLFSVITRVLDVRNGTRIRLIELENGGFKHAGHVTMKC